MSDGKAYVNGTHLRFSVYYPNLTRETLKELRKDGNYRYTNTYVSPVFASIGVPQSGETYLSEHPECLIFQEMSKRQVKKMEEKAGAVVRLLEVSVRKNILRSNL